MINSYICFKCYFIIIDNFELKINILNNEEDFLFLVNEFEKEFLKVEVNIYKEEKKY